MVLLKIVAFNDRGAVALRKVYGNRARLLYRMTIVSESPLTLVIEYGKKFGRIIAADSSLQAFARERGIRMGREAMEQYGAVDGDYGLEVKL